MTPKEKAQQIYDEMKGFRISNKNRKSTAKKCVKQIIEAIGTSTGYLTLSFNDRQELQNDFDFWNKVLTEIEKL